MLAALLVAGIVVDAGVQLLQKCEPEQLATRAANDIWLADRCGNLFRTSYGGHGWREVARTEAPASLLPPNERLVAMLWLSPSRGWMVSRSGRSVRTVDGGRTWTASTLPIGGRILAAARAGQRVWFCNEASQLVASDDGIDFVSRSLPFKDGCGLISFADDQHGWAAPSAGKRTSWGTHGRGFDSRGAATPDLWRTTDGGATWLRVTPPTSLPAMMAALETPEIGFAYAVDANGASQTFVTYDGGRLWRSSNGNHPEMPYLVIDEAHPWTSHLNLVHTQAASCRPVLGGPYPLQCLSSYPAETAARIDARTAIVVQNQKLRLFSDGKYARALPLVSRGGAQKESLAGSIEWGPDREVRWGWAGRHLYRSDGQGELVLVGSAPATIAAVQVRERPDTVLIRTEEQLVYQFELRTREWSTATEIEEIAAVVAAQDGDVRHLDCVASAKRGWLSLEFQEYGDLGGGRSTTLRLDWRHAPAILTGEINLHGEGRKVRRTISPTEAREVAVHALVARGKQAPRKHGRSDEHVYGSKVTWRCGNDRPRSINSVYDADIFREPPAPPLHRFVFDLVRAEQLRRK